MPMNRHSSSPMVRGPGPPRILIVGWFSQRDGGSATAGDMAACDVVCSWLNRAGWEYDVALGDPFAGGVDWERVDAAAYSHVLHVCGPVAPESEVAAVLQSFPCTPRVGVNVSMVRPLDEWNPFDPLIERDSPRAGRPDLAFAAPHVPVPVAGVVHVDDQP